MMVKTKKRNKRSKKAVASHDKKKLFLPLENISPDISPLKGFDENDLAPQDKDLVFDRLVNPDFKLKSMNRPVRTYVRERIPIQKNPVSEFENCRNRDNIIKWLNDTRNVFDRLTQESQSQHVDINSIPFTLDEPSISQSFSKRQKNRQQIPYRLRPRSLEIDYKKNESCGKRKRYNSLCAISPIEDSYSIEAVTTDNEEPFALADAEAKLVMDLLEDECLNSIDQELHQENQSDWDRIKDLSKTLNPPKLKQLNVTLYNKENKKDVVVPRKSYDLNLIESYFQEYMEKELNLAEDKKPDPLNELGNYFLNSLKKLTSENLMQFRPLIAQINALFPSNVKECSTQTTPCCHFDDKMTQTCFNRRSIEIQTDRSVCAIIAKETMNKQVQTDDSIKSQVFISKSSSNTTLIDSLPESEIDRLFSAMENNLKINEPKEKDHKNSNATTTTALNDSLDLCMDTEEFIKGQIYPKVADTPNKGKKRPRNESPIQDKSFVKKRPCDQFIEEDLSVEFLSEQIEGADVRSNSSVTVDDLFPCNNKTGNILKMNTQEEMEQLDDLIYNANKVVNRTLPSTDLEVITEDDDNSDQPAGETPKRGNINAANSKTSERRLSSESLFDDKELTMLQDKTLVNEEDVEIISVKSPKFRILQDIVLQKATESDLFDHVSVEDSCDSLSSDKDVVDATPVPDIPHSSKKENKLNITLPPPVEFQDSEKFNNSLRISPRRPLAVINKISSTPLPSKPNSESLSLSPIEDKRNLGQLEIMQQTKFYPLTVISTSSQKSSIKATPKQKSILNYVRQSQESTKSSNEQPSKRKPCITCSRLTRDEILLISSMANKNLITFTNYYSSKVTHLIVAVNKSTNRLLDYTIKFVRAVAAGIWVLNFQWIEECVAAKRLVPEGPFEVYDLSGASGPKSSRLTRHMNPLLKDFRIFVTNDFFSATKKEVEDIIKMVGGEVSSKLDDLRQNSSKICLILTENRETNACDICDEWLSDYKVATVDLEWLSASLGQYKLQNLRPYALCSENALDQLGYPKELTLSISYSASERTPRSGL